MLGFEILEDETLYLKVSTPDPNGQYINGIWYGGDPIITYDPIEGIWEPYQRGTDGDILPEGVKSSEAITLFSEYNLKTHNDLVGKATKADVIYIDSPDVDPDAQAYVVFDRATWIRNGGFELLGGHGEYIAIRQEKL